MLFDDKTKGIAQSYLSMLGESHFKVGDKVKCKASGMSGTVTKLDEPETGKYYTVKQDSGKMVKYAPDELKKLSTNESKLDPVNPKEVKKDFDDRKDKDIDNDGDVDSSDEYLHKRRKAISKSVAKEDVEIEIDKKKMKNNDEDEDEDEESVVITNKKEKKEKEDMSEAQDSSKIASSIEAYAKKSGGVDKTDMMKVASMIKRGDMKGAAKYAKTLDTDPRDFLLDKIGMMEDTEMDESIIGNFKAGFQKGMKDSLKKKIKPEHQSKYDFDAIKSISDRMKVFTTAKKAGHIIEDIENFEENKTVADIQRAAERRAGSVMKPKAATKRPMSSTQSSLSSIRSAAEKRRQNEDVEMDETYNSDVKRAFPSSGVKTGASAPKGTSYMPKDKKKAMGGPVNKMKEDIEQVDELSTSTLQSYKSKTSGSVNKRVSPTASKSEVQRKDRNQRVGGSSADNKIIKKAFEDYQWNWNAILEAPEEELDAMIEQMNDDELESFVTEFESIEEGNQLSTNSEQPMRPDGRETLDPRAPADRGFANAHRQQVDIKDYPGKDKPINNAKSQAPLRTGDKRNSEPKKTLSDIRNAMK